MGIRDEYAAFCLDEAIAVFYNGVHEILDKEENPHSRDRLLRKILGAQEKFADPFTMGLVKRG